MANFCGNCGTGLLPSAGFCSSCGEAVAEVIAAVGATDAQLRGKSVVSLQKTVPVRDAKVDADDPSLPYTCSVCAASGVGAGPCTCGANSWRVNPLGTSKRTTRCPDCGTFYDGRSCSSCDRILSRVPAVRGGARFVGDAAPIAGIPLSRLLNAACYVIAGIAAMVVSAQPGMPKLWTLLLGLAAVGYGIKIAVTRTSYWVNSGVYLVAIFAVIAALGIFA